MPETKDLKSRFKEVGTAIKQLFKSEHPKKVLDQPTIEKELSEFIKINGYDANDPNFDIENFQNEFIEFLKAKNYDFAGVEASLIPSQSAEIDGGGVLRALKKTVEFLKI